MVCKYHQQTTLVGEELSVYMYLHGEYNHITEKVENQELWAFHFLFTDGRTHIVIIAQIQGSCNLRKLHDASHARTQKIPLGVDCFSRGQVHLSPALDEPMQPQYHAFVLLVPCRAHFCRYFQ